MALPSQTLPGLGELLAAGFVRAGDAAELYGGDGAALPDAGARQTASPTTGQTVNMTNSSFTGFLYLTPAGTIAALTVALPAEANSILGQVRRITTSQAITALTLTQQGGGQTILGAPAGLTAGQTIAVMKVAANTWAVHA